MVKTVSLVDSILNDDLPAVEAAIAAWADVNASTSNSQWPLLYLAIEHQRVEIACRLIAPGARVNQDLGANWTPLVHAIDIESDAVWQAFHETGHEPTALTELLLGSGAFPTEFAFELAEGYDNRQALELLRRYEARINGGNPTARPRTNPRTPE